MQRKRDGLLPIREAFSGPDGSEKALQDASPQARHHFTQADQVDQLIGASEADPDLGFIGADDGALLPFGNLPRLLLAWVCTEAVRTQSRTLILGPSLAKFMKTLGVYSSGGGRDQIKLRNQMKRLFGCTVSMIYEDEHGEQFVSSLIAERGEFWWNERKPGERVLWDSKIRLGEAFFNEIINHPVPLDTNILTALKRSSLGLDLYLWLVYRTFTLRATLRLSWRQVYRQFGAHPAKASNNNTVQAFRYKILRELKKIKLAWPELNYTTPPGVLILYPSTPAIAPLNQVQLKAARLPLPGFSVARQRPHVTGLV